MASCAFSSFSYPNKWTSVSLTDNLMFNQWRSTFDVHEILKGELALYAGMRSPLYGLSPSSFSRGNIHDLSRQGQVIWGIARVGYWLQLLVSICALLCGCLICNVLEVLHVVLVKILARLPYEGHLQRCSMPMATWQQQGVHVSSVK
ncbi:hypothetical protein Ancab_039503 [Ancistrocladus abbreviatus]